jgi:surfeit locus 1 family protein
MVEAARRLFPVLLTLCAAFCLAVLCGLGTWQLYRLHWKNGLIAQRAAAMAAPPVTLTGATGETLPPSFARVRLAGRYLPGRQFAVGPRGWKRETGFHLIAPLRVASGRVVMVNRGWIPHDMKAALPPAPTGPVTVEGLLRMPGKRGWLTPANDPAKGDWFSIDPTMMARALGVGEAAPWWVAAGPGRDPNRPPIGGQGAEELPNPHLNYALTWFGIAAGLIGVYVAMLRRGRE